MGSLRSPNPSLRFAAKQKPIIIGATYQTNGLPKTVNPSYGLDSSLRSE
jgi:hypothetical protein